MAVFQGREMDFTGIGRNSDVYTQNTKTVADTRTNTRIDVFIPWKPVLLDNFDFIAECLATKVDGSAIDADGIGATNCVLSSACEQIETL
jgi:hypothetical protein